MNARSLRAVATAAGLSFLAGCANESAPPPSDDPQNELPRMHPSWRRTRLVVSDRDAARLAIVDVEFGERLPDLVLPRPVDALAVSSTGEFVATSGPNGVDVAYVGVSLVDHSQGAEDSATPHVHVYKFDPELLYLAIAGAGRPTVGARQGGFAILHAGTPDAVGGVTLLDLPALRREEGAKPFTLELPASENGRAFPSAAGAIVGRDGAVVAVDNGGASTQLSTCAGGPAATTAEGATLVLACADGLRLVASDKSVVDAPGIVATALASHVDREEVLAIQDGRVLAWSKDGQRDAARLDAHACDVAFEPGHGRSFTVLSVDGHLSVFDIEQGARLEEATVTAPFDCTAVVRPRLAQAPSRAYVLDPGAGVIRELWLDHDLELLREYPVEGAPNAMVVTGIDVATRNLGDLDDVE